MTLRDGVRATGAAIASSRGGMRSARRRFLAARTSVPLAAAAVVLLSAGLVGAPPAMAAQTSNDSTRYQPCAASALGLSVVDDPDASGAGQSLRYITLANTGRTVCRLTGAPRVSIVGHGDGTQIGAPADAVKQGAPPVVALAPGEAARAALHYTVVTEGGGPFDAACDAERADGYRVYPPASSRSLSVPAPQWACASAVHWGSVGAFDTSPTGPHDSAKGCRNTATMPKGATISSIQDVDGDARSDTQFYGVRGGTATTGGYLVYGIRTAAGGVYTIKDPLKGAAAHSGFTVSTDSPIARVLTVIDDRHTAKLYAFRGCGFVATAHKGGGAYEFAIGGSAKTGTGVACNDQNGGVLLMRATAKKRSNGRYDILWKLVSVSADGRTAVQDGQQDVRYSNLKASDPRVAQARGSFCSAQPLKVEPNED
jgi:hypothetical protein